MPKLSDWVKESVSGTPGTGTISLGGAFTPAFCKFQDCFTTGDKVFYAIQDGNNKEEGIGTLTSGTPWTLARTTVLRTLSSGTYNASSPTAISLTSAAIVGIAPTSDAFGIVVGSGYSNISSYFLCPSSAAVIASDDTIPQNTEGTEILTLTYTPKFADSKLIVEASLHASTAAAGTIVLSLFIGSSSDAARTSSSYIASASARETLPLYHEHSPGSTASITYKLRAGTNTATNMYVNGNALNTRVYGGAANTYLKVTEVRQ